MNDRVAQRKGIVGRTALPLAVIMWVLAALFCAGTACGEGIAPATPEAGITAAGPVEASPAPATIPVAAPVQLQAPQGPQEQLSEKSAEETPPSPDLPTAEKEPAALSSPETPPPLQAENPPGEDSATRTAEPVAQELAPSLVRLAVVGVSNQTGEKEFSKLLIAQGISQLVAQALFDTGRYVPVEDNPEITGKINELVALAASAGDAPVDYAMVDGRALGCDAMASAVIKRFSKSRMRGFMGPFSAANVDIEIEVEVAVREAGKPVLSASGSGKGTTKSRGVLFQVREDKVHFDQTSVGQATQEAVQQAVTRLLAEGGAGG